MSLMASSIGFAGEILTVFHCIKPLWTMNALTASALLRLHERDRFVLNHQHQRAGDEFHAHLPGHPRQFRGVSSASARALCCLRQGIDPVYAPASPRIAASSGLLSSSCLDRRRMAGVKKRPEIIRMTPPGKQASLANKFNLLCKMQVPENKGPHRPSWWNRRPSRRSALFLSLGAVV